MKSVFRQKPRRWAGTLVMLAGFASPMEMGLAAISPSDQCEAAADAAADEAGIPRPVMRAVTLAETGRRMDGAMRPWPWTVNFAGDGHWYPNRAEALAAAAARQAAGATNFDVGCFQINYRWHGSGFSSLDAMFDPDVNARYAARFLAGLYAQYGSWPDAAAAYHSTTEALAKPYRARFETLFAGSDLPQAAQPVALNRFPLLRAGKSGSVGSLVPLQPGLGNLLLAEP